MLRQKNVVQETEINHLNVNYLVMHITDDQIASLLVVVRFNIHKVTQEASLMRDIWL